MSTESFPCPCGLKQPYSACCGRYHRQFDETSTLGAPDAEALMRSRYSAYVQDLPAYLLASWHAISRPAALGLHQPGLRWLGLTVEQHLQQDADHATVEFVARSKLGGRAERQHEISRFVREKSAWYYLDGERQ